MDAQSLLEQIGHMVGDDPVTRGALAVTGGVLALTTAGAAMLRRRKEERVRVNLEAPPGASVEVKVNGQEK